MEKKHQTLPDHTFELIGKNGLIRKLPDVDERFVDCISRIANNTNQSKLYLNWLEVIPQSFLFFQILLAGMQIGGEDHTLLIPDEELASLRRVQTLHVICEDVLPKKLSDIRRLTADLAQRRRPLSWQDFERTVLTLVYTSQTLAQIADQNQRELWTDSLLQLFRAVQKDLRPSLETV